MLGTAAGGWRLAREAAKEGNSWVRLAWSVPASYGWRHTGVWDGWENLDGLEELEDLEELEGLEDLDALGELNKLEALENPDGLENPGAEGAGTSSGSGTAGDRTYREMECSPGNGGAIQDYEDTGIRTADVKKLKIEIGGARLYLLGSDSDTFGIKTEGKADYRCYEEGGTFYLEGNPDSLDFWEQHDGLDGECVYLYLPRKSVLKDAEIEVGGGLIEIDELSADKIDLSVGAGKVTAEILTCTSLDVETGAGEVLLNQVTARKAEVEIGMGRAFLQGSVSQEVDVDCDMGSAELVLSGKESDYNYKIDCEMGSIDVGGRTYSSLENTSKINNGAAAKCSLECSLGKISVMFTEE